MIDRLCGRLDTQILHTALTEALYVIGHYQCSIVIGEFRIVRVYQRDTPHNCISFNTCNGPFGNQLPSCLYPSLRFPVTNQIIHLHIFDPFFGYGFAYFYIVTDGKSGNISYRQTI